MEKENYTTEIDEAILKVMALGSIINRKTEICCFVSDIAHVRKLEVKLHKNVKLYNGTPVMFEFDYEVSKEYSWKVDSKSRLDNINRCVEFLEQTLKDKKINYEMLYAVKETIIASYEI